MGPGEPPPGAGKRRWRWFLVVVGRGGVGPDEAERRGHPERVWSVSRITTRDLEADRDFGLLPTPELDCVPRDADPAAVLVVELGVGEDGLQNRHLLRESVGHGSQPRLYRTFFANAWPGFSSTTSHSLRVRSVLSSRLISITGWSLGSRPIRRISRTVMVGRSQGYSSPSMLTK